ncbi:hypothetical protein MA3A0930S_3103 [Mycobacteroides abscessus 3A-0930-S]|uniref:hypothetical protein n=1 Tax=Mycobacteroides abscessus TaxID=36809 RepID=UPI000268425D|nr:hypothetical protein [Mycobacteroides abscessus]EIV23255.1 hypothetical protein MA3A0122R_4148 [Mycobacteroides abscessus 3A-0122-R]EIV24749.1 hypothetical protein MA3A0119R_3070 [Mycobacteroides abscessus 3A-0119-R]EIV35603.1 hypothetical protein MA3A0731_4143 [Mycobacteroides abscessus 3A-0731]EIV35791.1 hypothetical protein MA3A0122S_2686 [Mycobacteroides abscessus 3A-0122-S]EIV51238.1 hypothetical protein MA3A0930R_3174 [Mycobacteroides abscessus 3A-0930-R]EIV53698.1 hypothetical prote
MDSIEIGGEPTHVLHYAGQAIELLPEQAKGVSAAIRAARNGTVNVVDLGFTDAGSGATVRNLFLIGPAIPVLLVGPPIDNGR